MTGQAPTGQAGPLDATSDFNRLQFLVRQILTQVATGAEVQVMAVTNDGGVSPVGFVDVQPLVNLVDGAGVTMQHETIYNLPYFRIQGGVNAIIIDPAVGDIGIAIFADHDISAVKANRNQPPSNRPSPPGSARRFDLADGVYFGGNLNAAPVNFIQFDASGNINIVSTGNVAVTASGQATVTAPTVTIDASTSITFDTPTATFTGNVVIEGGLEVDGTATGEGGTFNIDGALTATGEVTANGGHTVSDHIHGGVQTGGGNTGTPTG